MASTDDESGSTNWREKYLDVANMLAETRAELDDFQHSSKELEEELERELERTERAQEDLKNRIARAESEREDWKTRFMSLQTTHNTTTTSLQRELDQLRQTHHQLKSQMRELEIGNDDLEGRERAITSSLNDLESRYSKVLEEKILLEQELLDKASLEEECQRLKDDKRDLNEEVDVLKEQIAEARAQLIAPSSSSLPSTNSSDENLMHTAVPDTLREQLRRQQQQPATFEDESPIGTSPSSATISVPESAPSSVGQSPVLFKRPSFKPGTPNAIPRSVTMPTTMSPSPSRLPMTRPPRMQTTTVVPRVSSFNAAVPSISKSKGVQMVSEMRTRVKALEQKIHSRVPRLRMGSMSGRGSSDSVSKDATKAEKTKTKEKTKETPERPGADGWVLIMEENTPIAQRHRRSTNSRDSLSSPERRRSISPTDPPSSFRRHASQSIQSPIPSVIPSSSRSASGLRRPASRLSASTDGGRSSIGSTISTSSAASTVASSRPCTPTFLPVPSGGMRSSTNTASNNSSAPRRSSLGTTQNSPPQPPSPRKRPTSVPMAGLPFLNTSNMDASQTRYRRGTPSPTKEMPSQLSHNPLSTTSRIGRPAAAPSAFASSLSRRAQDDSVTPAPGAPNGTTAGHRQLSRFRSGSFRS